MKYFTLLILICSLLGCVDKKINFYPSLYSGLSHEITSSNKPESAPLYSGFWQGYLEEGSYKEGIPTGLWKAFFINGMLRDFCFYGENNFFQSASYYPDGMLERQQQGFCHFQDGKRNLNYISTISFTPDGDMIYDTERKVGSGIKMGVVIRNSSTIPNVQILSFCSDLSSDGAFTIWVYCIPSTTPAEKITIHGKFLSDKELDININKNKILKMHLESAIIINNKTIQLNLKSAAFDAPTNKISVIADLTSL